MKETDLDWGVREGFPRAVPYKLGFETRLGIGK